MPPAHIGHHNVDIIDLAWGPELASGHMIDRCCPERHARLGNPLQINPKQVDAGRVGLGAAGKRPRIRKQLNGCWLELPLSPGRSSISIPTEPSTAGPTTGGRAEVVPSPWLSSGAYLVGAGHSDGHGCRRHNNGHSLRQVAPCNWSPFYDPS